MKNQNGIKKYVFALVLAFSLVGFTSIAVANNHYFVQMKVNKDASGLDIRTSKKDTGDCKGRKKKRGCVRVPVDDGNLMVSFLLAGNSKCKLQNGAKWRLNGVTLGGKNSSDKPKVWGGFESDQQVKDDFDFMDASKGTLNPDSTASDRIFTISDENQSTYTIWYKVAADCVGSNGKVLATIETDPRIENTGTMGR